MVLSSKIYLFIAIGLGVPARLAQAQGSRVAPSTFIERSPQEFRDPSGLNSSDLVQRALAGNADLAAARLDVERARGRLRQAGLSPNPTLDIDVTTGRWTGSPDEKEQSIGVTFPVELGGKRGRRMDLAQAEFEAAQAEVTDRERRLTVDVRLAYVDALAALRELDVTSDLNAIDQQTAKFIQVRVTEGDAPPLELNLLRAEVDRLRSRRALIQGRLEAAVGKLKSLVAISPGDPLRFREDIENALLPTPPTLEQSLQLAMTGRPDLQMARLTEAVAAAGLRLANAETTTDLALSGKFTAGHSSFDNTPIGALHDSDRVLSFGASITLPIRNRNQGAKTEAEAAILQARRRREFIEAQVRAEVTSAYNRYEAAHSASAIYEQGVIQRSTENIRAVRGAYEIGAFRITELLAEQRRAIDYQLEYTEALAEGYRALSELHAAIATPANP